jgi:hypothetical protein
MSEAECKRRFPAGMTKVAGAGMTKVTDAGITKKAGER